MIMVCDSLIRRLFACSLFVVGLNCAAVAGLGKFEPRHGDVVFQSLAGSPLTDMIEDCTRSNYSHCGIVVQENGEWKVIEAVGPVRVIPLAEWIHNGRHDGFAAYRLKSAYAARTDDFVKAAKSFLGRPYDIHYEMDDGKIYCSELIFKAFRKAVGEDLGRVVKLKELNWKPQTALIQKIEGGNVPLERAIITPINLAQAEQLECTFTRDISAVREGK